ncbi:hypothetical protein FRC12_001374 [Ceratobasidium sp. 428]|nr:hypothetical protein FRC12_001374 [Ceratobasidium sp. 428]
MGSIHNAPEPSPRDLGDDMKKIYKGLNALSHAVGEPGRTHPGLDLPVPSQGDAGGSRDGPGHRGDGYDNRIPA